MRVCYGKQAVPDGDIVLVRHNSCRDTAFPFDGYSRNVAGCYGAAILTVDGGKDGYYLLGDIRSVVRCDVRGGLPTVLFARNLELQRAS